MPSSSTPSPLAPPSKDHGRTWGTGIAVVFFVGLSVMNLLQFNDVTDAVPSASYWAFQPGQVTSLDPAGQPSPFLIREGGRNFGLGLHLGSIAPRSTYVLPPDLGLDLTKLYGFGQAEQIITFDYDPDSFPVPESVESDVVTGEDGDVGTYRIELDPHGDAPILVRFEGEEVVFFHASQYPPALRDEVLP